MTTVVASGNQPASAADWFTECGTFSPQLKNGGWPWTNEG
jgi:hypothetical protein